MLTHDKNKQPNIKGFTKEWGHSVRKVLGPIPITYTNTPTHFDY